MLTEIKITQCNNILWRHYEKIGNSVAYDLFLKKFLLFEGAAAVICKICTENTTISINNIFNILSRTFNCASTEESTIRNDCLKIIKFLEQSKLFKFSPSLAGHLEHEAIDYSSSNTYDNEENIHNVDVIQQLKKITTKALIPFVVILELTDCCPLQCTHCYCPQKVDSVWNLENFKKILAELKALGTMEIVFTGGECMAHSLAEECFDLAYNSGFLVSFLTNGMLITKQKAKKLASYHPGLLQISLYASNADTHDAITQVPGSFERTMAGIRYLQEEGINPEIACSIMKTNYHAVDNLREWCDKNNLQCSFNFNVFYSYNSEKKLQAGFKEPWFEKLFLDPRLNPRLKTTKILKQSCNQNNFDKKLCSAGSCNLTLSTDGSVLFCNVFRVKCGSILEQSLSEIWKESELLNKWRQVTVKSYPKCATCQAFALCSPCPAQYFIETGSWSSGKIDEQTCYLGNKLYEAVQTGSVV